jgi:hypothetical protein
MKGARDIGRTPKILDQYIVQMLIRHGLLKIFVDSLDIMVIPSASAHEKIRIDQILDDFAIMINQIQRLAACETRSNYFGTWRWFFGWYAFSCCVTPARQFSFGTWPDENIHRPWA